MNSQVLTNWIQVFTGIAVLVGLGLVVWELQQTRDLVRAQLVTDGYISRSDTQRTFLGESFASTYAKACFQPEELTDAELFQMTKYAEHLRSEVIRAQGYQDIGDYSVGWEQLARSNLSEWLSTKVGRADYADLKKKGRLQPWVKEIAEDMLEKEEIISCAEDYKDYFELVRAKGEPLLR